MLLSLSLPPAFPRSLSPGISFSPSLSRPFLPLLVSPLRALWLSRMFFVLAVASSLAHFTFLLLLPASHLLCKPSSLLPRRLLSLPLSYTSPFSLVSPLFSPLHPAALVLFFTNLGLIPHVVPSALLFFRLSALCFLSCYPCRAAPLYFPYPVTPSSPTTNTCLIPAVSGSLLCCSHLASFCAPEALLAADLTRWLLCFLVLCSSFRSPPLPFILLCPLS